MRLTQLPLLRIIYLAASLVSISLLLAAYFSGSLTDHLQNIDETIQIDIFKNILATTHSGSKIITLTYLLLIAAFLLSHLFIIILLARPVKRREFLHLSRAVFYSSWGAVLLYYLYGLTVFPALVPAIVVIFSCVLFTFAYYFLIEAFRAYPSVLTEERVKNLFWDIKKKFRKKKRVVSKETSLGRLRRDTLAWQYRKMRGTPLFDPDAPILFRKSNRPFKGYHLNLIVWKKNIAFSVVLGVSLLLYILPGVLFREDSPDFFGLFFTPVFVALFLGIFSILDKLMMDYHTREISIRRQVLWIMIGLFFPVFFYLVLFLGGIFLVLIYPDLGIIDYFFNSITTLLPVIAYIILIICLMISIYLYGAIDPERAIKTSTLYALLGIIFTVLFVTVEQFISPLIVNLTGLPGMAGTIIAGTIVALILAPLRNIVDIKLDKILKIPNTTGPDEIQ